MTEAAHGLAGALALIVLLLASIALIAYVAYRASRTVARALRGGPPPRVVPDAGPQPLPDEQIRARVRWDRHEREGIVRGTGLLGDVAAVFVDEEAFLALDPVAQADYADTLNCAALGPGRSMPEIVFVGHLSDRPIARWTREGIVLL